MGGKGRRRREKNYKAAHGCNSRLPPPPDPSKLDALPTKLRKIMSFASQSQPQPSADVSKEQNMMKVRERIVTQKETSVKAKVLLRTATVDLGGGKRLNVPHQGGDEDHSSQKKKRKRKRGEVGDLQFEATQEELSINSKRKKRKKHREARQRKHKKSGNEENLDFPGYEKVEFGDVVQAPPKLVAIPKVLKVSHDASQERLRLQAIEAYRNRKGWSSRPGSLLPSSMAS